MQIHALFFIRNTVKFRMVLFLIFPPKDTSPVAYLFLIFTNISCSLVSYKPKVTVRVKKSCEFGTENCNIHHLFFHVHIIKSIHIEKLSISSNLCFFSLGFLVNVILMFLNFTWLTRACFLHF